MNASALYNRDILRLAASLVPSDTIVNPDATAEARSITCGSQIAVDILLDEARAIAELAIRANACTLGQASAAILKANAKGQSDSAIMAIRSGLADGLQHGAAMPAIWPQLELFAVARDFPARHSAILLPYDAVLAAWEQTN
jgi:NifU-like protein involved in Fe-S cluster formation